VVIFAPTLAMEVNELLFVLRSILNPSSLLELSVHVNLLCVADNIVTIKLLGAGGVTYAGPFELFLQLFVIAKRSKIENKKTFFIPCLI